jgi:hypothetical protein
MMVFAEQENLLAAQPDDFRIHVCWLGSNKLKLVS